MTSFSGTASFNYTRDQIIYSAARKMGAIASGETLSASAIQDFADQLNIMVKALNATGLHIWTEEEATLFLQPNQVSYTLGGTTTDNAVWQSSSPWVGTTLTTAANSGATSLSLAATTGFAANNFVGVVLNSGSIFWTTQSGATAGNLAAGLSGPANAQNAVYTYTTQIERPLRVPERAARRYAFSGAIETPMVTLSRLDYRNLPNKNAPGTPTQIFYDPRGGANNQGIISIWPAPPDVTAAINFTWWRPIEDFNSPGNNPDLPTEWLNALIWNLADQMKLEYDCPAQRAAMIQQEAQSSLDLVMGWDREPESYLFGFNADQT